MDFDSKTPKFSLPGAKNMIFMKNAPPCFQNPQNKGGAFFIKKTGNPKIFRLRLAEKPKFKDVLEPLV